MRFRAALLLFALAGAGATPPSPPVAVCEFVKSPGQHLGETVTIRGSFGTDGIERAVVIPGGCKHGLGVGNISDETAVTIDDLARSAGPAFRIDAEVRGVIVRVAPNTFEFHQDHGYRLNIISISPSHRPAAKRAVHSGHIEGTSNKPSDRP